VTTDLQPAVDASTVERVLLDGDLAKLTPAQRVSYYTRVCDSVGLNPLTRPFEYITLNGKLTLYARREASEQLRRRNHVSITITARELLEGETYVVTAKATLPDNRCDESIGVKSLKGLVGESRANAMMTAETKSKRRVTLSICGLGLLDETEIADIPDVAKPALSGYATVPAPPPELVAVPEPPEGFVYIERIDSAPTKNPKILRYRVSLSSGEVAHTINAMLASLAEACCRDRTPVKVKSKSTQWGLELVGLEREHDAREPEQPELTADDIPF
jgi:hypothetical protein